MIRLMTPIQIADRALDPLVCKGAIGRDDEAVIAARHPVVDADAVAHEARCGIARITRPLGDRDIFFVQLNRSPLTEDARVLRVHPRLDCRE